MIEYTFSLDVHEIGAQVYLTAKQGGSGVMRISLRENENPYAIPDGSTAVFAATKADGNVIFNNCTVEGNTIVYELTAQTVAVLGEMLCEIRVYNGGLLISPHFTLNIVPTAVSDGDIQSLTEVNTLTGLINEAAALTRNFAADSEALLLDVDQRADAIVNEVRAEVESGAFVPELEIGTVTTLQPGANATANIRGTGKKPLLDLGIPQGPVGTAEGLVFDTELSKESINPVQNKVIAEEFEKVRSEQDEYAQGVEDSFAIVGECLEDKVDKVTNKGLSTNDFTDILKQKLDSIEEGANKYELGTGAVATANLAGSAVTAAKIAANAVSKSLTVTLAVASWSSKKQTVAASGVTTSNTVIVSPAAASFLAYSEAQVRCISQAANSLTFQCETVPTAALTVTVTYINK